MGSKKTRILADLAPQTQLYYISDIIHRKNITIQDLAPLSSLEINETAYMEMKGDIDENIMRCLVSLDQFEEVVHEFFPSRIKIYVLGDESIERLLRTVFSEEIAPTIDQLAILELLHACSIIYRLAYSPKFGYNPSRFKQTRISGWGRAVCRRGEDVTYAKDRKIRQMVTDHIDEYREIVALCTAERRPLDTS
jgi:hypothetical protein